MTAGEFGPELTFAPLTLPQRLLGDLDVTAIAAVLSGAEFDAFWQALGTVIQLGVTAEHRNAPQPNQDHSCPQHGPETQRR